MDESTDGDEGAALGEWYSDGPRGATAIADMTAALTGCGLLTPPVPLALADRLMTTYEGGVWGTDARWSSWAVYSVLGELTPAIMPDCLATDGDDFWLCGQRGRGINSYAFGLVARLGPLVVSQQIGYGGIYEERDETTERVNCGSRAWSRTLAALEESTYSGPARYLVLFSNYRDYALIATASPDVKPRAVEAEVDLPTFDGWRTVVALDRWGSSGQQRQVLEALVESDNPLLAIAARHLEALFLAEPTVNDADE